MIFKATIIGVLLFSIGYLITGGYLYVLRYMRGECRKCGRTKIDWRGVTVCPKCDLI